MQDDKTVVASDDDDSGASKAKAVVNTRRSRPNILMIMVDQLRYPGTDGAEGGFAEGIKQVLDFVGDIDPDNNEWAQYFPGFCKLREHGVVFTDHTIAESACIPSRASIMTGQYGPRTGVTQTDGLFKSGDAQNFPWLKADGAPTIGDYFRELDYTTHYFGKWHVSDPPEHTLQGFGFGDWELSWPEPHGSLTNNMGAYRDYQFADLACTFLRARALGVPYARSTGTVSAKAPEVSTVPPPKPFFAVCSFTNPHDIATYPTLPRMLKPQFPPQQPNEPPQEQEPYGPGLSVPVPEQGTYSAKPLNGTFHIPLNPAGFRQDCATASATQGEDLWTNNKPRAQFDYSYKVALGLAAKTGLQVAEQLGGDPGEQLEEAVKATLAVPIPFQLQERADAAATGFLQYYGYMISMVDRHILKVLETLEETGLRDDTVVVFASDHGEYGGAHGMMMEKWHGAYQESVHVPFVISSKHYNGAVEPVSIDAQSSHIDILPTLLGIAGADDKQIERARRNLSKTHPAAPLPGADLTAVIDAGGGPVRGPDGRERLGVLFATDDMITEPLPRDDDPHNINSQRQYAVFTAAVEALRSGKAPRAVPDLTPGPVCQPAHVRALRSGDWKLVRYCDPWSPDPVPDQWELYNLAVDPTEYVNLVVYNGTFPTPIPDQDLPRGLTQDRVVEVARTLHAELMRQEATLLSPYPSAYPTGRP
ncbi:sulfatase-like hydrolase/transferase [Oleiagrimonas sp. MCCC 1A03011]|uniref:sulfatase-like hydrolase/transferase n=1 Tax=Oleiagrimonas sp. MCCC 1A03011 TaxID=1926883 RepID=UPI000DD56E17|nr:sulfatase-like hydrolase/transferase [Oleiagrimonas sp. MCCC 1A03011]